MFTRTIAAVFICAATAAGAGPCETPVLDAATRVEITENLTARGYEVRRTAVKGRYYQAHVMKNGIWMVFDLTPDLDIVRVYRDG